MTQATLDDEYIANREEFYVILKELRATIEGTSEHSNLLRRLLIAWEKFTIKRQLGIETKDSEIKKLFELMHNQEYENFKKTIGKHWSWGPIKSGLLSLCFEDKGSYEKIKELRHHVANSYPQHGIYVFNLASTSYFKVFSKYFYQLKNGGSFSKNEMAHRFDVLLADWEDKTIFIKKIESESEIDERITSRIMANPPLILIFSHGYKTCKAAKKTLARLKMDKIFSRNRYMLTPYKARTKKRVEKYLWVIEKYSLYSDNSECSDSRR